MATYQYITLAEMSQFIDDISQGQAVSLPMKKQPLWHGEYVYEWFVAPQLTLRVYSSVTAEDGARPVGTDAIRVVLLAEGIRETSYGSYALYMVPLGKQKRVHRVVGWRDNLTKRINSWREWLTPQCPRCLAYTVQRVNQHTKEQFYSCVRYPLCLGSVSAKS